MKPFSYLIIVLTLACIVSLAVVSVIGCVSDPAVARVDQTAEHAETTGIKAPILSPQDSTVALVTKLFSDGWAKLQANARAAAVDKSRNQESAQTGTGNVQTNDQSERPLDKRLLYILGAISLCSTYPVYRLFEVIESRVGLTLWKRRIQQARDVAHKNLEPERTFPHR